MDWKFVKPLVDENTIKEFEEKISRTLPDSLKKDIIEHNGGRPKSWIFNTNKGGNRMFKGLLSFNKEDSNNIFQALEWDIGPDNQDDYVIIGQDPFGNYICMDKDLEEMVFINKNSFVVEYIADNYSEFIEKLH